MLQVELPTPLRITYATESSCVESWLCARRHEPAFGFDTETRPAFRKGEVFAPATLQLSTATDCLVVHLAHLEAPFPAALVEVLASPDALMCGLGIDDDAIELWLHHGLEVFGRVELLSMPGASKGSSLAGLSESLLGARLGKSKRLTMTRWDKRPLLNDELAYAAVDAWAGHACHGALLQRLLQRRAAVGQGQPPRQLPPRQSLPRQLLADAPEGDAPEGAAVGEASDGGGAGEERPGVAERSCAELYARRRVRRILRDGFVALDAELSEAGLPHAGPWPTANSRQGKRQAKEVRRHLSRARSTVFKLLGADSAVVSSGGGGGGGGGSVGEPAASAKSARRAEAAAQAAATQAATVLAQAQAREKTRGAARQKEEARAEAREQAAEEAKRVRRERRAQRATRSIPYPDTFNTADDY